MTLCSSQLWTILSIRFYNPDFENKTDQVGQ